jgi:hypothetical protein
MITTIYLDDSNLVGRELWSFHLDIIQISLFYLSCCTDHHVLEMQLEHWDLEVVAQLVAAHECCF